LEDDIKLGLKKQGASSIAESREYSNNLPGSEKDGNFFILLTTINFLRGFFSRKQEL
jgi:hypothetical protein